ncbi:D-amino acid dehydrogenase [Allopusillimonas ginsengisoli]|uniref:D-amino acid dehydrogenase n=1 Tax=Allopusillimonas ginsengisoli TaxID=453575 RepID=UPI0010C1C134|nr:D-amino acid dehydrogenase [Allopusillimonas ginsengisoli]
MHVCIIGAGIIGTSTAWQFARQGARVTLIEASSGAGLATSYANGGQLSYSYVAPLAEPGVLPYLPKWLFNGESPLRFRPRLDPHQWRWCLAFMLACRSSQVKDTTAAMLTLSYLSRDTLHQWMNETPISFHHKTNGKLIAYRSPALVKKARKLVAYQAGYGAQQSVLNRQECIALEPALGELGEALAGAVYTPGEEVGDCHLLTTGLFNAISRHSAAVVRTGAHVRKLIRSGNRIVAAELDSGEHITADHFVVAAGMASRRLLQTVNEEAMLYGLKGYSLSIPMSDAPGAAPAISVTDYERRIVYAPIGPVMRIAAMVDMGDRSADINPQRIALLKRQVNNTFPSLDTASATEWAGERPATPTGKPIIGRSHAAENLWLNIGHGALGFTVACGSAVLLQALVSGQPVPINARPFASR